MCVCARVCVRVCYVCDEFLDSYPNCVCVCVLSQWLDYIGKGGSVARLDRRGRVSGWNRTDGGGPGGSTISYQ